MGKKIYTDENMRVIRDNADERIQNANDATRQAQEDAATLADALTEAYQEIDSLVNGKAEAIIAEPVDHKEFTVTIRYRHTKYATEDSNDLIYLMKELGEDEYRFVTDHFTIMGVDYDQYEE